VIWRLRRGLHGSKGGRVRADDRGIKGRESPFALDSSIGAEKSLSVGLSPDVEADTAFAATSVRSSAGVTIQTNAERDAWQRPRSRLSFAVSRRNSPWPPRSGAAGRRACDAAPWCRASGGLQLAERALASSAVGGVVDRAWTACSVSCGWQNLAMVARPRRHARG